MIVITIIEQGKMQYRPTLISNLYSHLNKHRLMSIFRDIMALLVSIYRDCIFLISPSTSRVYYVNLYHVLKFAFVYKFISNTTIIK